MKPWPGEIGFQAPVSVPSLNSLGTPIQAGGTTCGLNVAIGIVRDGAKRVRKETEMVSRAIQKRVWSFKFRERTGKLQGSGLDSQGMAQLLHYDGATPRILSRTPTLSEYKKFLEKDAKVAVLMNAGTPSRPAWHWVRFEGIKCGKWQSHVVYGDPWTGKSWTVPFRTFQKRVAENGVVVAKFKSS